MFDKINFQYYQGSYTSKTVKEDVTYQNRIKDQLPSGDVEEYYISGNSRFILPHPISEEKQEKLMYVQSFSYNEERYPSFTRRQNYPSLLLLYTYSGSASLTYAGKTYQLEEHMGALIDCRIAHEYRVASESWIQGSLHFYGGSSELFFKSFIDAENPVFFCHDGSHFQMILEEILRTHMSSSKFRDYLVDNRIQNLLIYVSDCLKDKSDLEQIPENILLLRTYLENNFTRSISLDEMASFAGFSKYYLIKQFKKYTDFTPADYVLNLRLEYAQTLLRSTNIPGYKISEIVGFSGESNFIQAFRRKYGSTPNQYRKRLSVSSHL